MKSQKIKNDFSDFCSLLSVFLNSGAFFQLLKKKKVREPGFQAPTFFQLCHDDYGIIIPYYGNDGWMVGLQARGDDDSDDKKYDQ